MTVPLFRYVASITLQDHAGKIARTFWYISAADYAAYAADYTTGSVRVLIDDYMALTLDNKITETVSTEAYQVIAPVPFPTSENAVNSAKLEVLGRDNVTGKAFKQEIPARNGAAYVSTRGLVDITSAGAAKTYITKRNAVALSEDNNATTVVQVRVIGKGSQA
jgi:hypothetical protein